MRRFLALPAVCLASSIPALAAANPPATPQASDLAAAFGTLLPGFPSQIETSVPWTSAGNDLTDNHFASSEFILNPYTLPFVTQRWVFAANGEVQGTPTVEGQNVYVADQGGSVYQLNAQTGTPNWQTSLINISGNSQSTSRNSPAIGTAAVIVGDQGQGTVYALSKANGSLLWQTTVSPNPNAVVTSSPVIVNGRVYVGVASSSETLASKQPNFVPTFRGSVVALDESTGKIVWQAYTVPQGFTGGAVWESNFAIDTARQSVFVTTGNNYSVPAATAACQTAATTPAAQDACLPKNDYIDSVLAMDLNTGAVKWSNRFTHLDTWTVSCESFTPTRATPCPVPTGLDTDFGAGANLFTVTANGQTVDAVGAGQKSGAYFAMNRDTGQILWGTQVGPDGTIGGIEWGTATDGQRIYIGEGDSNYNEVTLIPSGNKTKGGFWSALDVNTGQILWQTPTFMPAPFPSPTSARLGNPPPGALAPAEGSVSVANGVMYAEDTAGTFVALSTVNGQVLRYFNSGGAAISAPAIVDGALYWASGYSSNGATNNKVYSFWIGIQ